MPDRARRLTILALTVLFIVSAGTVLPYSQGWRLNWTTWKWQKVGGLYIKSNPRSAEIFLNGKPLRNKTGFLDRGTLVSGINPGRYKLRLASSGFQSWEREITVEPEIVSEIKYAVLAPELGTAEVLNDLPEAKKFHLLDNRIIVKTTSSTLVAEDIDLPGEELITLSGPRDSTILTRTASGTVYAFDLGRATTTAQLTPTPRNGLTATDRIIADPSTPGAMFVIRPQRVLHLNLINGRETELAVYPKAQTIGELWASRGFAAWSVGGATSTLAVWNRSGHLISKASLPNKVSEAKWIYDDTLLLRMEDGDLFLYRANENMLRPIFVRANVLAISSDGNNVAVITSGRLEVFNFVDQGIYFRAPFPNAEKVLKLGWYKDNRHLLVTYSDRVDLLELGDHALENIRTVAPTRDTQYEPGENILYFLDGGKVKYLQFGRD